MVQRSEVFLDVSPYTSLILRMLSVDTIQRVAVLLAAEDLLCFRLACRAFKAHSNSLARPRRRRSPFFRTLALAEYAWQWLPHFREGSAAPLVLAARISGNLAVLDFLYSRGCAPDAIMCRVAASSGQVHVLRWARERGCLWDARTCALAAAGGHLEVLRFAHANGCAWGTGTSLHAAAGGHLEVLRWACEHGCPWDVSACPHAAAGGHLEVLRWAFANSWPMSWPDTVSQAARRGQLHVLTWAQTVGSAPGPSTCHLAAAGGHLDVLRWARERGCPWGPTTCYFAAAAGHLHVLRWCVESGCEWCVPACAAAADRLLRAEEEAREEADSDGAQSDEDAREDRQERSRRAGAENEEAHLRYGALLAMRKWIAQFEPADALEAEGEDSGAAEA